MKKKTGRKKFQQKYLLLTLIYIWIFFRSFRLQPKESKKEQIKRMSEKKNKYIKWVV